MAKNRSNNAVQKYVPFSDRINELLCPKDKRYKKITHKKLAEMLGVDTQTVDKWCTAQKMPKHIFTVGKDDATIEHIVELFNAEPYNRHISIQWLLCGDDHTNKKAKITCEYTGLNEEAIDNIRSLNKDDMLEPLEMLLQSKRFAPLLLSIKRLNDANTFDYQIEGEPILKGEYDKTLAVELSNLGVSKNFTRLVDDLFPNIKK